MRTSIQLAYIVSFDTVVREADPQGHLKKIT